MTLHTSRIVGTGAYAPSRVMTNDELATRVDTSDQWIRERTGIRQRHVAAEDETTSDMAVAASRRALEMAGLAPEDLDLIVMGTVTADMPLPAASAFVQARLGAVNAAAFDIAAACAGSVYGMAVADAFIRTGRYRHVLVIGAELLTRVVDWGDRNTVVLFGDGAGAMILAPSEEPGRGILSTHLHTDGAQTGILNIPGGGSLHPVSEEVVREGLDKVKMNGREVYKHAVRHLEEVAREALAANGLTSDEVTHVVAHQANLRILDAVLDRLEIPRERAVVNIHEYGNTSSASVPMTLDEANRSGRLAPGDVILMMAIGAGLSWGGAVVRW